MDGIECSRAETTAKDKSAVFADVLCQVDGFRRRSQTFPATLPKLESGLGANQDFIDSEGQLRKVADGLPVIFNSNFEDSLTFSRSSGRRETKNRNQEQNPAVDAAHYRLEESREAISLRISFSSHLSV